MLTRRRLLVDQARCGPTFLRQPAIAPLVLASLEYGAEAEHYQLLDDYAQSRPSAAHSSGGRIAQSGQRQTSQPAAPADRTAFWRDESYDHLIRRDHEFRRIQEYIEDNPVTACLAAQPEKDA